MIQKMKINMISFTDTGSRLNTNLNRQLKESGTLCVSYAVERFALLYGLNPLKGKIQTWIGERWGADAFLFIGAAGIAVRYIAPWVKDKFTDSPVLVMDEKGEFIIPLLSGHVGGAVEIANAVAELTGAVPVITTATDVQRQFAVDVFARRNELTIEDRELAKSISAAILEGKKIGFYTDLPIEGEVPKCIKLCRTSEELMQSMPGFAVMEADRGKGQLKVKALEALKAEAVSLESERSPVLLLTFVPKITAGIGCRRGTAAAQLHEGLLEVLAPFHILPEQIEAIASIDLKKDEEGLIKLAKEYNVPFQTFTAEELSTIKSVSSRSEFVERATGIDNVCERAAVCESPGGELLLPKTVLKGCTYALVKRRKTLTF